jgi:hypothetical protein
MVIVTSRTNTQRLLLYSQRLNPGLSRITPDPKASLEEAFGSDSSSIDSQSLIFSRLQHRLNPLLRRTFEQALRTK